MTEPRTEFSERAPAKINLTLEILGKRADGFHELLSLVAFARDAADQVLLDTSQPIGSTVSGPFSATIAGQNLIDVTLAKLAAADSQLVLGHVSLTKNLPVAAGIGGGSADAAAVLRAVRRANPECAEHIDWHSIARSLGADVPVCLQSSLSWMRGIGERVTPVAGSDIHLLHLVVANPRVAVPADKTAQVFRALGAPPLSVSSAALPAMHVSADGSQTIRRLIVDGRNDLELAAIEIVPAAAEVLSDLAALPGARFARLSGGGPTCFALFDTAEQAALACAALKAKRPEWWVVATALA